MPRESKYCKAVKIIRNKLMYEVDPFDFMEYETYEDYYQNYYEEIYESKYGEGYPNWWLEKDEFNLLKEVFGKKYQNL